MNEIVHVLLTRYNLPSAGAEAYVRTRENWLAQRTALFGRYTVPSVRGQVAHRPHWIVYLDPASPEWLLAHMDELRSGGVLTPILRTSVDGDELRHDIRVTTGREEGTLVTTNLDNDDGLSIDFALRLRAAAMTVARRSALYVPRGLILHNDRVFLHRDRYNAFCSVVEDLRTADTCWLDWHNRLHRHMPTHAVDGGPGWLQVVHGDNVSNRVRGHRVDPDVYRSLFAPGALDRLDSPGRLDVLLDRLTSTPYRFLRDTSRSSARSLAIALAGKEGLGAAKARWARRRGR